jgi:hypothetical protein
MRIDCRKSDGPINCATRLFFCCFRSDRSHHIGQLRLSVLACDMIRSGRFGLRGEGLHLRSCRGTLDVAPHNQPRIWVQEGLRVLTPSELEDSVASHSGGEEKIIWEFRMTERLSNYSNSRAGSMRPDKTRRLPAKRQWIVLFRANLSSAAA